MHQGLYLYVFDKPRVDYTLARGPVRRRAQVGPIGPVDLRTALFAPKVTSLTPMGHSFGSAAKHFVYAARDILYASSYRQDNTYHDFGTPALLESEIPQIVLCEGSIRRPTHKGRTPYHARYYIPLLYIVLLTKKTNMFL